MDQMDCSTSTAPASSTSPSSLSNYRGRIPWPGGPAKKQNFSLPDGIIYYIARNPKSPELYLKLAKSSKYFFEMLPLLIAKRIKIEKGEKRMCTKSLDECKKKKKKCCVKLDLAKLTRSKIWLLDHLFISGNENVAQILLLKLYCCENAIIKFYRKEMSMEEYKLWGTVFQKIIIDEAIVIENDGSIVTLDSLLEAIHDVKDFRYWLDDGTPAAVTSTTMKIILQLKNLVKLELFVLLNISEAFPVKDLTAFMKTYKDTKFNLCFHPDISDEYKRQLDGLVDDIVASAIGNRRMYYLGQDGDKLKIMESRYRD